MDSAAEYGAFRSKHDVLVAFADEAAQGYTNLGRPDQAQLFRRAAERLRAERFKVVVVGMFSTGKSTVINALLGREVLPAYATETTRVVSEVKWGSEPRALAHRNDGGVLTVPVAQLADYVTNAAYAKVELFWPLAICRNGIDIIDSPGLNAHAARERITQECLDTADAVIVVVDCQQLGTDIELRFVDEQLHPAGHADVFFVCNKVNLLRSETDLRRVRSAGQQKLVPRTRFGASGVYYANALAALEARAAGAELAFDDEFARFERDLATFLTGDLGVVKLVRNAVELKRMARTAQSLVPQQVRALQADRGVVERKLDALGATALRLERERVAEVERANTAIGFIATAVESAAQALYEELIAAAVPLAQRSTANPHLSFSAIESSARFAEYSTFARDIIADVNGTLQNAAGEWYAVTLSTIILERLRLLGDLGPLSAAGETEFGVPFDVRCELSSSTFAWNYQKEISGARGWSWLKLGFAFEQWFKNAVGEEFARELRSTGRSRCAALGAGVKAFLEGVRDTWNTATLGVIDQARRGGEAERSSLEVEREFLAGAERHLVGWSGRFDAVADAVDDIVAAAASRPGQRFGGKGIGH
jgi:GTPase SAR1 family protein